jgi:hypothetical protein
VTAGEDEPQPFVLHRSLFGRLICGVQQEGLRVPVLAGCFTAEAIDRSVAGGGDDPAGGAWRDTPVRPSFDRLGERVLDRLLGDVDVTESADQDSNRSSIFLAEDSLDFCCVQSSVSS